MNDPLKSKQLWGRSRYRPKTLSSLKQEVAEPWSRGRRAHLSGRLLPGAVLGPAPGCPGALQGERKPRPPYRHLAPRVGVFRFRDLRSSQAPRPSPGNNRRSSPELPSAPPPAALWPLLPPARPSPRLGRAPRCPRIPRSPAPVRPGSPAPGSALSPLVLPLFSCGPAQPQPRRGSRPGLSVSLPPPPPTPPRELLFLANPLRAATRSARSRAAALASYPSRAAAAAAAAAVRPAQRVAHTQPATPRPPPSPPSPPQAPAAAGKSLLAEQRRSPSQLSVTPLLLPRHSLLLRERWLFGEGGEVRGSSARGEGGRDSLGGSGRR